MLAFSGGLDSQTLLHLTAMAETGKHVVAIHINHGLSDQAQKWQEHCEEVCADYKVEFRALAVQVTDQGKGLEAAAREARYQALETEMEAGDLLLMAHHLDDQIETFFLRLLRGAGLDGLSSMAPTRAFGLGVLGRPLLEKTRAELVDYASDQGFAWIEDESNQDTRFDRNFLRHELFPIISKRWPMYRKTVGRAVQHIQKVAGETNEHFQNELEHRLTYDGAMKVVGLGEQSELSETDQISLIHHWIKTQGVESPSEKQLGEIYRSVALAKADAEPVVEVGEYSVRRFKSAMFLVPKLPPIDVREFQLTPDNPKHISGLGLVELQSKTADGQKVLLSNRCLPLKLSFRLGGEIARPAGRHGRRDLKRLLQEYRVAPWWRDITPLAYWQGQLVAVGDLFVCDGFQAEPGEQGFELVWQKPSMQDNPH